MEIVQPYKQDPSDVELTVGITPILSGTNGLFLYDNHGILGEQAITPTSPASPSGSIQYNNSGSFGGSSNATLDGSGNITANSFIKSGGTSSQFLKADGSVDSSTYLTSLSGALLATGATTGATSQSQVFTNGITNSLLTPGSVVFAGTAGVESQDNTNFFYDSTNHRLALGTSTSISTLTLNGDMTFPTGANRTIAIQNATSGAGNGLTLKSGAGFSTSGGGGGNFAFTAGAGADGPFNSGNGGSFAITSGNGGTLITGTLNAGTGGNVTITSGAGGDFLSSQPNATGANGGNFSFTSGNGGQANSPYVGGTNTSGNGGSFTISTGVTPIAPSPIPSNYSSGQSGSLTIQTGNGSNNSGRSTIGGFSGGMTIKAGGGGSSANGFSGGSSGLILISGGSGGDSTDAGAGNNTGGSGGSLTFTAGNGGLANNSTTKNQSGSGGSLSFSSGYAVQAGSTGVDSLVIGGNGGDLTFTAKYGASGIGKSGGSFNSTGGNGGTLTLTGSQGGAAQNGLVAKAGNGSNLAFIGGVGGNAAGGSTSNTGGNGGSLWFVGGAAGSSSGTSPTNGTIGNVYFNTTSAGAVRGLTSIGVAGNTALTAQLQVNTLTASGINTILKNNATPGDFLQLQNSGATVLSKFNSQAVFFPVQAPTASAPTYVLGGMYFDTTLNKLRIGGAVGWETVTSV